MENNVLDQLELVCQWLTFQAVDLSNGLKSMEDAIKLYRHWQERDYLPEFADDWLDDEEVSDKLKKERIEALGYDPLDV